METILSGDPTVYALDKRWVFMSGMMMLLAGGAHLVIVPDQFAHAPAHALFFLVAGIAEVVWGLAFWRKPTKKMLVLGVGLAVSLIVLWAINLLLPAPFTDVPEELDLSGIITKLLEIAGVVFLTLAAFSSLDGRRAWRLVFETALIAVMVGALVYQVGLAAEPLFPFLRAPGSESVPTQHIH